VLLGAAATVIMLAAGRGGGMMLRRSLGGWAARWATAASTCNMLYGVRLYLKGHS
jgi:hypothetical protein